MLKRTGLDDNAFIRANTLNDMKANDTLKVGDVVAVAETYRFYNIKGATESGAIEIANNLFAVPISPPDINYSDIVGIPDLGVYMPLAGNSTKNGNLAITGTLTSGEFTSSGNVTAYSDVRLKRDVEDIGNVLEKIMNVKVVEFKMLGDEHKRYGVIAQELRKIFPELVLADTNSILRVDYITLNLLLIKAFQEYVAKRGGM